MLINALGWIGMILMQIATVPTIVNILQGTITALPPLDMVLLIWSGLLSFLIRSILNKEWLYAMSNSIGFINQSILLTLILLA
jgi:hypothetical protein